MISDQGARSLSSKSSTKRNLVATVRHEGAQVPTLNVSRVKREGQCWGLAPSIAWPANRALQLA